ncbi:hypothetical protein GQ457_03G011290 [Hibiscus cannabinus]
MKKAQCKRMMVPHSGGALNDALAFGHPPFLVFKQAVKWDPVFQTRIKKPAADGEILRLDGVDFPILSTQPSLERPISPVPEEDQRATKKVKNKGELGVEESQISQAAVGNDRVVVVSQANDTHDSKLDGPYDVLMPGGEGGANQSMQVDETAVSGATAAKVPAKSVLNPDDIVVADDDVTIDDSGGSKYASNCYCSTLRATDWLRMLWNRVKAMWSPQGQFQLVDLENDYFLVKFDLETEFVRVLADGPWTIFGSYLTVQPWTREFSSSQTFPSHVLVWVRLPGLPYRYYTKALFRRIAAVLGSIVKVDYNTIVGDRGKFARLAVMVDLNKPLRSYLGIDNFMQHLEYEGLQNICFKCGIYGHSKEVCGQMGEATEAPGTPTNNPLPFPINKGKALSTDEMYGPWMIVSDKKRRPRKKIESSRDLELNSGKSRFAVLSNVEVEEQVAPIFAAIDVNAGIHCEQPSSPKTGASSSGSKKVTKKGIKGSDQGPQVIETTNFVIEPTIPGQVLNVVGEGLLSKGHNKAVSIVEDGTALDGGKRGGLKKGLKGVSNLKLQVRKQSAFKAPNLPLLSEWVNSLSCNVSVRKHSHVPVASSSTQGDPPDTISHTNNVHGNGLEGNLGDIDMVQIGNMAALTTVLGHFRRVVRDSKPVLVALFEPRISGSRASSVIRKLGFPKSFRVEAHGFSGGIWILWKEELVVQVLKISNQYVHMRVRFSATEPPVFITAVYASPNATLRKYVWDQLFNLNPGTEHAWLLGGDFNAIYDSMDRSGGSRSRLGISRGMANFVFNTGLTDAQLQGPRFTWKRGSLSQRIDRCLLNDKWLESFPDSLVFHLDRFGSDHRPILLRSTFGEERQVVKPFRFVFAWQSHPDFKDILRRVWDKKKSVLDNLQHCQESLISWNSSVFGHIGQRKRQLVARLRGIDKYLASKPSDFLSTLEKTLRTELDLVLEQEESLWIQKSRCKWYSDGDRNTRYFHACARSRRRVNTILALRNDEGDWCVEQESLRQIARSHFALLFTSSGNSLPSYSIRNGFNQMDDYSSNALAARRAMRLFDITMRACLPERCNRFSKPWQHVVSNRWTVPHCHWIKVNTDGARNTGSGLTACGGVGRDSEGNWCFGFSRALGLCSVLEAELWGVYEGLATAWSLGYTRVIMEMDCRDAYEMLAEGNPRRLGSSLLSGLLEMRQRSWDIQFHFIRREGNQAADLMARLAWQGTPEYCRYMDPPLVIRDILISDKANLHSKPNDEADVAIEKKMDSEVNHVCYCDVRSKLTMSWTYENPGRRFWGCGNYRNGVRGCKYFSWYDPAVTERSKGVIAWARHGEELIWLMLKGVVGRLDFSDGGSASLWLGGSPSWLEADTSSGHHSILGFRSTALEAKSVGDAKSSLVHYTSVDETISEVTSFLLSWNFIMYVILLSQIKIPEKGTSIILS